MIFIEKPVSCRATEVHTAVFGRCVCCVVLQHAKECLVFLFDSMQKNAIGNT